MAGDRRRVERRGRADYSRLTAVLASRSEPVVTLSWAELDYIVGGLPPSAVNHHPQWWHGDRPNTRAWRAAGFELASVEVNGWVTFRRTGCVAPDTSANPVDRTTPLSGASGQSSTAALRDVDPRAALLVVPCSAAKHPGGRPAQRSATSWPSALAQARTGVLAGAALDDSRVLPAWRRYAGTFYRYADEALAEAVANGKVLIISGGYGLVRATEPIGTYEKVLRLGDWPPGLMETLLVDEARRTAAATVVAFVATSTGYARLVRRTRWRDAEVPALLVTITGVTGGAMVEVHRRLGQAFAAFWSRRHDRYPAGTSVERLA